MNDRKADVRFGSRPVRLADLASLVRAPAALSVPGDILAGAAAAGRPLGPRTVGTMASSVCLYWAGMALNDYADATIDAVERPQRPVPSGRVPRRTALSLAGGLTAAGLGLAALSGGRRGLGVALPLTGLIWAYDLKLKSTKAGPAAMAGARALDVLAGAVTAGGTKSGRRGLVPAALVGLHTYTLTALSRHEISGAPARLPATTLGVSAATALAAAGTAPSGPGRHPDARTAAVAAAGALGYLGTYGLAQVKAVREPSGENVRRAVGAGILGLVPLQTALTARGGSPVVAAALGAVHPLARRLARRVSPT
ncbi:SCO3242 family prenyltransferase [Streptomyces ureilyticus]|uniref:UbiA family prenyltransferase n=1 Tax=Streptomyces ureilyticus TaxID=1775131 RepID=A0ABX0DUV0_9ACTN|nr:UbiA family prenyltransferase [Streptomyces ureilyticus]NGO44594.1 UbiA family prenyltransferase [Streptomyces ureilyticus]